MTDRNDDDTVRITMIAKPAAQAIMPSRPKIADGQTFIPRRESVPRLSVSMGQSSLEPVPEGSRRLVRKRGANNRVTTDWMPIAEAGETLEFKDVDANPPQRRPYVIGT